jgi:hypothetical protein
MKSLSFSTAPENAKNGRRIRRARFDLRSALPISAACVVANGVRETLGALLGRPAGMRLFEPSIPSPSAWLAIARDARLYRVRGNVADAAIVLRPADAIALAAALFGEACAEPGSARALSPIECDVMDRMATAIAANFGAVCGTRESQKAERIATIGGFVTYFELFVDEPVVARIGVGLSREPGPAPRGHVEVGQLGDVRLKTFASIQAGKLEAAAIVRLAVGTIVPIPPAAFDRCNLMAHGRRIARGTCGVHNGRYALTVQTP